MNARTPRGRLEVVHGSMFAGKTEHMIARLRQAQAAGRRVRAFKHAIDNRYDPHHLVTHTRDQFDADPVPDAAAIVPASIEQDFVAIDEGQFFKKELLSTVQKLLDRGVSVIVAGITHDAWGRPFSPMPELIALADEVTTKYSPCRSCGRPAPYTQRMTPATTLHMVGGLGEYEPRCAEHFTPLSDPPEARE